MKDIRYMTSLQADRLMKHCTPASGMSWCDVRYGARVQAGKSARVFVRDGCRVTAGSMSRIVLHDGILFVLGDFTLMPRACLDLHRGMLVLGGGYLGYGSFLSCDEKLWIVDADIGPQCYICDTDGHHIRKADGSSDSMYAPTVIHEHVFIGPGSTVLKGSDIGAGTVVGPRSLVRGALPAACYAEGVPAAPTEQGITWERRPMDMELMV